MIYIFLEDFIVIFSTLSNLRNISMMTALFFITGGFSFPDYFSMPYTLYTGFSDLSRLRLCLTSALTTFRCLLLPGCSVSIFSHFTTNAMALSGLFFTHRDLLPCTPSHILVHLGFRCEKEYLIQDLPICLLSYSCPFWLAYGHELQDGCFTNYASRN